MNLNKYTEKAQEAVLAAQNLAESENHPQVEPEHLLLALAQQQDGVVPALLRKLQLDPAAIARDARHAIGRQPKVHGGSAASISPRLKLVTDLASAEAERLKVPPTTQNGQVFRLRGQGMSMVGKPGERSDLYATVEIQVPREVSAEERAHHEALAKLAGTNHPAA